MLVILLSLGLSESIETRLPEDPAMVYTVGFKHDGVRIGLDWKDRQVVPERVCRKAERSALAACQQAALSWLKSECGWYGKKSTLNAAQQDMQSAVCSGAKNLSAYISAQQVAKR